MLDRPEERRNPTRFLPDYQGGWVLMYVCMFIEKESDRQIA